MRQNTRRVVLLDTGSLLGKYLNPYGRIAFAALSILHSWKGGPYEAAFLLGWLRMRIIVNAAITASLIKPKLWYRDIPKMVIDRSENDFEGRKMATGLLYLTAWSTIAYYGAKKLAPNPPAGVHALRRLK